ncbi:MAG: L-seryl-tRNA(Sec) selenium transferase [bacterium]|nr:L-seryl-tRNA(Sec) selenium transferase [bacterium]
MPDLQPRLREIPQISAVLADARLAGFLAGRRRMWAGQVVQQQCDALRERLRDEAGPVRGRAELHEELVTAAVATCQGLLRPAWTKVINGTGVVVHTNLGRAPLPAAAANAARDVSMHYTDLEMDLQSGRRDHRGRAVERKAALLAGAEDALVVNNNAAALWLAVRHLGRGGPVLLSRGEVVAIGGSFRLHEIIAETGCRLVEVGTTNRTTVDDYRRALEPGALVLKVHRSNFAMAGFTAEASLADLAAMCAAEACPLVYDAGSGLLVEPAELGLPPGESVLAADVATGCDLVTCSGDKLLGGCQAGLVLGRAELIEALRGHPLRRAVRVDKSTLAALDAVLTAYLTATSLPDLPAIAALAAPAERLREQAGRLRGLVEPNLPGGWSVAVEQGVSSVGGGAYSTTELPTWLLRLRGPREELETCHARLREQDPAVLVRLNQDGLAVDPRTITDDEIATVAAAFAGVWATSGNRDGKRG